MLNNKYLYVMKAIFVAYSQAYNEEIIEVLDHFGQRGYTRWMDIGGRGGKDGVPHLGSHAWPEMNHAIITFAEDEMAGKLLRAFRRKDAEMPSLGLRAFSWTVDTPE